MSTFHNDIEFLHREINSNASVKYFVPRGDGTMELSSSSERNKIQRLLEANAIENFLSFFFIFSKQNLIYHVKSLEMFVHEFESNTRGNYFTNMLSNGKYSKIKTNTKTNRFISISYASTSTSEFSCSGFCGNANRFTNELRNTGKAVAT